MIQFTISFIAGIAAFNFFPYFPVTSIALCIVACLILMIVPPAHLSIRRNRIFAVLIILIFIFGFVYSAGRHNVLPEQELPEHDAVVQGTVVGSPEQKMGNIVFTLDENYLEGRKMPGKIRLYLSTENTVPGSDGMQLSPGDSVSVVAKLRMPHSLNNPGVFAYDLKREGIAASGYVKQVLLLSRGSGVMNGIYKIRQKLAGLIEYSLSAESASLLKAIIPGFAGGLSRELRDAFSTAGLAHLLSISGTHFGLLAFMVFKVIKSAVKWLPGSFLLRLSLFSTSTQIAVLTTLPVLIIYALLSGGSTPTIRSLVMVSLYMLALLLGRKDQWLNSLSIAAFIILLWQPDSLFQLSFLLSFLAVLSIGYVLEKRKEQREVHGYTAENTEIRMKIEGLMEKLKTAPLMTVAALLGTAPLVAAVFKQFPLIAPASNIIVTPIVCFFILPFGVVSGLFALICGMPVMPLNGIIDSAAGFALWLIKIFSEIPCSNVPVHYPSPVLTVLYYGALLVLASSGGACNDRIISVKRSLPFVLVVALYIAGPFLSGDSFSVAFLDVGQGDASVVELPDGKVMLIDGSTMKPDMGRLAVAPYLWSKGIRKVDYMVLSHTHPDHLGGLVYLLHNFNVEEVWMNGRFTPESAEFVQRVNDKKINFRTLNRGDVLETERYRISVLHPYNGFNASSPRGEFSNQNSDSLVLKIETPLASVLFAGDIERETEENLLYLGGWLDSDIIKVPHHGSRTSSSGEFIHLVSPEIAVASVGRDNPFGHPHQDVIERYIHSGARMFRTDIDGAVIVSSYGGKYSISTGKSRMFNKVSIWRDELRNLKLLLSGFLFPGIAFE